MADSKQFSKVTVSKAARFGMLNDKVNVQFMKRVQEIRKIAQRHSWKPEALTPLVQAKLSNLLP